MEAKFESLTIFKFQTMFPTEESCMAFLEKKKWERGYTCFKCGHKHFCSGGEKYIRQCTSCRYKESVTANTLFHKIKFSLRKAFMIIYFVSTNKKGISTTELSRKLGIGQKTCWLFKQKVMQAMKSMSNTQLYGNIEIVDFELGKKKVKQAGKIVYQKKRIILAIEKKGKGVSRIYAQHIQNLSSKELKKFMDRYIAKSAAIRINGLPGFIPLMKEYSKVECCTIKDKNKSMVLVNRVKLGIEAWLRGIHGHAEHLQYYLDEYSFRFNRNRMKEEIFEVLLNRMMVHPPRTYLDIIH